MMRHLLAAAALLPALVGLLSPPAWALIDPKFTPVHLAREAEWIAAFEIQLTDDAPELRGRVQRQLKGRAAADTPTIELKQSSANRRQELREALGDKRALAVMFIGKFSGKFFSVPGDDTAAAKPTGKAALCVGHRWFTLAASAAGRWKLDEKNDGEARLQTVWAGSADMLVRAVEYALSDPAAIIPTTEGVGWGAKRQIGQVDGRVAAAAAVDVRGDGQLWLFLANEAGDRLWSFEKGTGKATDGTQSVGLGSQSRAFAWGHFTGTTRLDLLSSDGKTLTLWAQDERGRFQRREFETALPRGGIGLSAIDVGHPQRAGVVVSTDAAPILLTPEASGSWKSTELPAPEGAAQLGRPLPCLVADLHGDGRIDLLQPRQSGSVLYRGRRPGEFAPPTIFKTPRTGPGARMAICGDWDGDGRLDLFIVGANGALAWHNLGDGQFREVLDESGEAYNIDRGAITAAACDFNNDGRQDLVVAYAEGRAPQLFFNRGFFTFGFAAAGMKLDDESIEGIDDGVQAAVMADFNGDGAQQLALVLADGRVWSLARATGLGEGGKSPSALAARVRLPAGPAGPINVVGFDGRRALGVQLLAPGGHAFFGKPEKGPLRLVWRGVDGAEHGNTLPVLQRTDAVLDGP